MENKDTETVSLKSKLYTEQEVVTILGVSKTTAYREIKRFNGKLEAQRYITVTGKISKRFFKERAYF